jgi:hypothetical protein
LRYAALADDDRPYTDGPVVRVDSVRTEYGHFDDYVKFLDGTWVEAANQGAVDRAKMRRPIGTTTMQVLQLK